MDALKFVYVNIKMQGRMKQCCWSNTGRNSYSKNDHVLRIFLGRKEKTTTKTLYKIYL